MSATDELRRMLDERGVEWSATDTYRLLVTSWNDASGHSWAFVEHKDGNFSKLTAYHLTPEQAIAATLGGMKMYAVKTWTDLDDIGESYIERKLYRSKEDAERRAEEVEAESSDFRYYASVVEFEVVEP